MRKEVDAIFLTGRQSWTPHWALTDLVSALGEIPDRTNERLYGAGQLDQSARQGVEGFADGRGQVNLGEHPEPGPGGRGKISGNQSVDLFQRPVQGRYPAVALRRATREILAMARTARQEGVLVSTVYDALALRYQGRIINEAINNLNLSRRIVRFSNCRVNGVSQPARLFLPEFY